MIFDRINKRLLHFKWKFVAFILLYNKRKRKIFLCWHITIYLFSIQIIMHSCVSVVPIDFEIKFTRPTIGDFFFDILNATDVDVALLQPLFETGRARYCWRAAKPTVKNISYFMAIVEIDRRVNIIHFDILNKKRCIPVKRIYKHRDNIRI